MHSILSHLDWGRRHMGVKGIVGIANSENGQDAGRQDDQNVILGAHTGGREELTISGDHHTLTVADIQNHVLRVSLNGWHEVILCILILSSLLLLSLQCLRERLCSQKIYSDIFKIM